MRVRATRPLTPLALILALALTLTRAHLLDPRLVAEGVDDDHGVAVGEQARLLASLEGGAHVVAVAARLGAVDLVRGRAGVGAGVGLEVGVRG